MLMQIFSVYDGKSKAFARPFFSFNVSTATRELQASVREGGSLLSKFPDDFQLWHIGTFNDEVGSVDPLVPPVCVCNVSSLRGSDES